MKHIIITFAIAMFSAAPIGSETPNTLTPQEAQEQWVKQNQKIQHELNSKAARS